jgi:hypothetical protein
MMDQIALKGIDYIISFLNNFLIKIQKKRHWNHFSWAYYGTKCKLELFSTGLIKFKLEIFSIA